MRGEVGKEETLHVSCPVEASKLGMGSDLGDAFFFCIVDFG